MVGLGLARVADDEVAAERRVGLAVADVGDASQEAVAVAPAPHPPQQRLADVLQRQVEVRHAGGADHVDQRVGEIARVEVQQPHPVGALGDGLDERHDRARRRARRAGPCRTTRGPGRRARSRGRRAGRPRARIDATSRLRCGPRNVGMAQNPHERSQPSAIFTYAHGAVDRGRGRLSRSSVGTRRVGPGSVMSGVGSTPRASTGTPKPATWSTSGSASASSSP